MQPRSRIEQNIPASRVPDSLTCVVGSSHHTSLDISVPSPWFGPLTTVGGTLYVGFNGQIISANICTSENTDEAHHEHTLASGMRGCRVGPGASLSVFMI